MQQSQGDGVRLVVGVDGLAAGEYALDLAQRLAFRAPRRYVLVNAVESIMPDGTFPPFRYEHPLASELREREALGTQRLSKAAQTIDDAEAGTEERQVHNEPSQALIQTAKETQADLVVVGHNRRGLLDDLVLGSTARRLLRDCPQHILVARPQPEPTQGLVALIASDDSPESEGCVQEFIRLAPKGLEKVYVLTVNEIDSGAASMLVRGLPHLQRKAEQWIAEGLERDNRALCARLGAAGFDSEPLVVEGHDTATAISQACDATRASIVVIAARPHGFWDRLWRGSVSDQIFAQDTRSLLVLRP